MFGSRPGRHMEVKGGGSGSGSVIGSDTEWGLVLRSGKIAGGW